MVAEVEFVLNTYGNPTLSFVRGQGCYLYDEHGNAYLDFLSGIGVSALGHAHPKLTQAIAAQAGQLLHCSNLYRITRQHEVARMLCQPQGLAAAFFCNSGTEANEAAFKFARLYQSSRGRPYAYRVASLKHSFHGRTLASLAATGSSKFHTKFQPLPQGFDNWPAQLDVFRELLDDTYAAVIVEAVQGESGVRPIDGDFLTGLATLARERGVLLIADEVQCGMGRTGRFFAYQHHDLQPDMVTVAKGMGGGVPTGAALVSKEVAQCVSPGDHGSTFGGNPLAMAAAEVVIGQVSEPHFLTKVGRMGELLRTRLTEALSRFGLAVRGRGLMLAVYHPAGLVSTEQWNQLLDRCYRAGLLANVAGGAALRLLPPLIVGEEEIERAVSTVAAAAGEVWA